MRIRSVLLAAMRRRLALRPVACLPAGRRRGQTPISMAPYEWRIRRTRPTGGSWSNWGSATVVRTYTETQYAYKISASGSNAPSFSASRQWGAFRLVIVSSDAGFGGPLRVAYPPHTAGGRVVVPLGRSHRRQYLGRGCGPLPRRPPTAGYFGSTPSRRHRLLQRDAHRRVLVAAVAHLEPSL